MIHLFQVFSLQKVTHSILFLSICVEKAGAAMDNQNPEQVILELKQKFEESESQRNEYKTQVENLLVLLQQNQTLHTQLFNLQKENDVLLGWRFDHEHLIKDNDLLTQKCKNLEIQHQDELVGYQMVMEKIYKQLLETQQSLAHEQQRKQQSQQQTIPSVVDSDFNHNYSYAAQANADTVCYSYS